MIGRMWERVPPPAAEESKNNREYVKMATVLEKR